MKSFVKKSYNALRQFKFGVFKVFLNRLLKDKFTYENYLIYSFNLQQDLPEPLAAETDVEVKRVQSSGDKVFKEFHKKFPAPEFVSRIEKETETAYIATKNGEAVAYAWVTEEALFLDEINYRYPLDSDEIYFYSCYVSGEHRGQGIHSLLLYHRLRDYIHDQGYTTAYTAVISANAGSIKGIEKTGFKKLTSIRYLKLFNKEEWWGLTPGHSFKPISATDATGA